ncbi:MAG: HU family DNA-binding protein [Prolixibacteraceae bacterium]|jgi:predicted histone-like DNA-binding protein
MSLKVKIVNKKNPLHLEEPSKFYASAVHLRKIELDQLATSVAERCSLRRSDVHGVLIALMDIIPSELLEGNIIDLGNLGSFYVSVKSEGVATEEDCSVTQIAGTRIQFRPAKKLKKQMRMIDFSYAI